MQAHIVVLEFPPSDSVSSRVSFESLKGTWFKFFSEANAEMQLLSAAMDLLMFLASWSLAPSEPVFESLSDPAKSTMVNKAFRRCLFFIWEPPPEFFGNLLAGLFGCSSFSVSTHLYSMKICSTAWLRDEFLFIAVAFTFLLFAPYLIN